MGETLVKLTLLRLYMLRGEHATYMVFWHWGNSGHANTIKIAYAQRGTCNLLTNCNQNIDTFSSIND